MIARLKKIARIAILFASLGFIAHFFYENQASLEILRRVDPRQIALLLCLSVAQLTLYAFRMHLVLEKCSEQRITYGSWFRIFLLSRFLNTVAPQLGNVYRGVKLKSEHNVSYTRYIAGFASFTWIGTWLNFAIALVVILLTDPNLSLGPLKVTHIVFAVTLGLAVSPFVIDFIMQRLRFRVRRLEWINSKLNEVVRTSLDSLRDVRYLAKFLVVSLMMFVVICVMFRVCFASLGIEAGLSQIVLFYIVMQLMTYFVLTPGNLGIQELTFGMLGEQLGIGMAEGILVSALLRMVFYVVLYGLAVPLGGLAELRRSKSLRNDAAQ